MMTFVTLWPAKNILIPITPIFKKKKLKLLPLLQKLKRILGVEFFSTKLSRAFNMLVYPVCLYNILNNISPGILFKCQICYVLCNHSGYEGLRSKIYPWKKSGYLYSHVHLHQALETPSNFNCQTSTQKWRVVYCFMRRMFFTGFLLD